MRENPTVMTTLEKSSNKVLEFYNLFIYKNVYSPSQTDLNLQCYVNKSMTFLL